MSEEEPKRKLSPGTILLRRVKLVGAGIVPRELFEKFSRDAWDIFLTEPDPDAWPPEMQELAEWFRKYEQPDDQAEDAQPNEGEEKQP